MSDTWKLVVYLCERVHCLTDWKAHDVEVAGACRGYIKISREAQHWKLGQWCILYVQAYAWDEQ